MAQYEQAISPQTLSQINAYLRQVRASGRPVTQADIRSAYQAALQAEADKSIESRRFAAQREQGEETLKLQKEAIEDQKSANRMAGVATLGSALWQMGGKEAITGGIKKLWPSGTGGGGAQTQITGGVNTSTPTGATQTPAITTSGTTSSGAGTSDALPTQSPSSSVESSGGMMGSAGEFATDYVVPGLMGSGVGYGVKSLTGSTAAGMAVGAGIGALSGYAQEGDIVSGLVGGLLGSIGGFF